MGRRIINGQVVSDDGEEGGDRILNIDGGAYVEHFEGDYIQGDSINLQGNVVSDGTNWWEQTETTATPEAYSGDTIDVQAAPVEEPKHTKPWWME